MWSLSCGGIHNFMSTKSNTRPQCAQCSRTSSVTNAAQFAGNLVDWWEPSTKASYLRKASCIIEQYGGYKIERLGLSLNGINTQGENIADNGGIKEAYRAYSE